MAEPNWTDLFGPGGHPYLEYLYASGQRIAVMSYLRARAAAAKDSDHA